jgi:hypothetical protein
LIIPNLEQGTVSTEFIPKNIREELSDCQRYYWSTLGGGNFAMLGTGNVASSSLGRINVEYPVPMRTFGGTLIVTLPINLNDGATSHVVTSMTSADAVRTKKNAQLEVNSSALTVGNGARLGINNSLSAFIAFDDEL